jgi:hypothetical protein
MRFLPFLILCFLTVPAFAQDAEKKQVKAATEVTDGKSPVDWVKVESTGILGDVKAGALEKTLWKDQKRSEIEFLVQKLPTNISLRSILSLQRRLLLTRTDSSLIINDIGPLRGNDLLIQRINKLMDMGLYDAAWELYTQKAEDPYDVSIAQLGMLLLVMKDDLATACLEEKVFSSRYPKDKFFKTMDAACSETLGTGKPGEFADSAVLQSVYHNPSFTVPASSTQSLLKMTDLERALVLANGRIKYEGLTRDTLANTPPLLLSLFLMDKNLPENAKAMIKAETDARGLSWYIKAVAQDADWKKAKDMKKDLEAQWPLIESAINSAKNPADLAIYYGDMLSQAEPKELSTMTLRHALGVFLAGGRELPEFWLNAAQKKASENPLFYIYLQAFHSLTPTAEAKVSSENLQKGLERLKSADLDQILAIIETLDKDAAILNNPLRIYEKHSVLTLEGNYVMPSLGLNVLLETAPEQKQLGITVLAVLNSLAAEPDNMYSGTVRKALYSMLNVGLIEDAKLIGAETVASVLNKY